MRAPDWLEKMPSIKEIESHCASTENTPLNQIFTKQLRNSSNHNNNHSNQNNHNNSSNRNSNSSSSSSSDLPPGALGAGKMKVTPPNDSEDDILVGVDGSGNQFYITKALQDLPYQLPSIQDKLPTWILQRASNSSVAGTGVFIQRKSTKDAEKVVGKVAGGESRSYAVSLFVRENSPGTPESG